MKSKKFTVINYTLEQFMEQNKRDENVIKTLEKMSKLMSKFEKIIILNNSEVKILKRKIKKLEAKNDK